MLGTLTFPCLMEKGSGWFLYERVLTLKEKKKIFTVPVMLSANVNAAVETTYASH